MFSNTVDHSQAMTVMSRPLIPRPSFGDPESVPVSGTSKPRKISTACGACKTRKTKCSGTSPCEACSTRGSNCVYDQASDQRRKIANQRNLQDLVEAQTSLQRHKELLGGIISTIRVGGTQANSDLLDTIRSGVDLSQLSAHVRNARRADAAIDYAFLEINFIIDGPEELPSPDQILQSMQQSHGLSSHDSLSDGADSTIPMTFLEGRFNRDAPEADD